MTRVLVVAITVGLLVVAGFGTIGIAPPETANAETAQTPSESPTVTPGWTPNDSTALPPGTSTSGIDNVSRLVASHRSVLNNTTSTARAEWGQTPGTSDPRLSDSDGGPVTLTVSSGPNASLLRFVDGDVENVYWMTDDATASRTSLAIPQVPPSYAYHSRPQNVGFQSSIHASLRGWLNTATYDYTGTITRDNRTLHEFWATGPRENATRFEDVHGRVLVDEDGVIHEAVVVRTARRSDDTARARFQYTIHQLGTTAPTQPEWVTAELPHLNASVTGNGTVVALEHTGGASVSNAAIETFVPDGPQVDAEIEEFEPGETLYLYRVASAPDRLRVSENEAPRTNDSFLPVGADPVLVSVFDYRSTASGANESLLIEVEPADRRETRSSRGELGDSESSLR